MKPRTRGRIADVLVAVGIVGLIGYYAVTRPPKAVKSTFEQQVDLAPLAKVAVQYEGRNRSFDSHARTILKQITGTYPVNGQAHSFTYLDLMFRPERYDHTDVIYVKNELVRRRIGDELVRIGAASPEWLKGFKSRGMISRQHLELPAIRSLRDDLSKDLIRTARPMSEIQGALNLSEPSTLADFLQCIPPQAGDRLTRWLPASWLWAAADPASASKQRINSEGAERLGKLAPEVVEPLQRAWSGLVKGWQTENAAQVNTAVASLADLLPN
ncbi:MAG TPA: hypothetical protein VGM03_11660, partial [Phycisphaerae bacterium]